MAESNLLLPDPIWHAVAGVFDAPSKPTGRPRLRVRRVLSGILYVKSTGTPWKELPSSFGFGAGNTCRRRYMQWLDDGTWARFYETFRSRCFEDDDSAANAQLLEDWLRLLEDRHEAARRPAAVAQEAPVATRFSPVLFSRRIMSRRHRLLIAIEDDLMNSDRCKHQVGEVGDDAVVL